MKTHSPTPWMIEMNGAKEPVINSPDGYILAACGKNKEANSKLAAAAPDLLAACQNIVKYYMDMSGNPNFPVADKYWLEGAIMARAAIAKATA